MAAVWVVSYRVNKLLTSWKSTCFNFIWCWTKTLPCFLLPYCYKAFQPLLETYVYLDSWIPKKRRKEHQANNASSESTFDISRSQTVQTISIERKWYCDGRAKTENKRKRIRIWPIFERFCYNLSACVTVDMGHNWTPYWKGNIFKYLWFFLLLIQWRVYNSSKAKSW